MNDWGERFGGNGIAVDSFQKWLGDLVSFTDREAALLTFWLYTERKEGNHELKVFVSELEFILDPDERQNWFNQIMDYVYEIRSERFTHRKKIKKLPK